MPRTTLSRLSQLPLVPLSYLYGAITSARSTLYRTGLLPSHRAPAPVISIGNLTAGGTGKTPLVARLAGALAEMGQKPCVLTRGYGRRTSAAQRVLVSDGERLLADARSGGDEPQLLAEKLLGRAAVISDADRAAAALWAVAHLGSTVFVLDDGFQHRRLARDLDIVVVDATDPWSNRQLLPRGLLREPLTALGRAHVVVITRAAQAADVARLSAEIRRYTAAQILISRMKSLPLKPLLPTMPEDCPREVGAFCALGNPASFFAQLRAAGYTLKSTTAFRDHHYYTPDELHVLIRKTREAGGQALITTSKDAVKLRDLAFSIPCFVADIEIDFDTADNQTLRGLLESVLCSRFESSR